METPVRNRIVIFDLDDTLIDRSGAFSRWARTWADRRGLGPGTAEWLVDADDDSDRPRAALFAEAARHFDLPTPVEELVDEFYREIPAFVVPAPAVIEGLARIRGRGWKTGVATNGSYAQRPKMRAAGIAGHVDGVCVSQEVGVSKPDPRIFEMVAESSGATLDGGWMVGDSPASDIAGGMGVGLRTIWISRGRDWAVDGVDPTVTVPDIRAAFDYLNGAAGINRGS
jgi:FMN phosphatase YigB (HAD superfamily)